MDIALAADDFIRHGQYLRNWSPRTIRKYRTGTGVLRQAVRNSGLTKADLQLFVIAMCERGLTAGGCNMYIRTVNSFLTWLHEDGRGVGSPTVMCLHAVYSGEGVFPE
jgi:hypothetical protein